MAKALIFIKYIPLVESSGKLLKEDFSIITFWKHEKQVFAMKDKEFYIGYLPKMPKSFAKIIRPFVGLILAAGIVFSVLFLFGQSPFANSVFEFGNIKDFEGTIQAEPIPFLLLEKAEKNNGLPTFERIPLVAEFKEGADKLVKDFNGQRVKLRGTRIYRDDLQMIEVVADSVEKADGEAQKPDDIEESLGTQTLKGEIIDSKCYLGVMNPGNHKTHKVCAINCLRGGIPALFVVKDTHGNISELWLLGKDGKPINKQILDFVAEPVEMTGEVKRKGDQLYFYSNPNLIKRLP